MQLRIPARVNLLSLGRHLIRPGLELNLMQSTPSMAPATTFAPLTTLVGRCTFRKKQRERDAFACIERHQAFALAPVQVQFQNPC
jgi:hypothetical protein